MDWRPLLKDLIPALDMLACRRREDGAFEPLHEAPQWRELLQWGEPPYRFDTPQFSFLENFLVDAAEVWDGRRERLDSGVWIEAADDVVHLSAVALKSRGENLLVVRRLASNAEMDVAVLQRGREEYLRFERDRVRQEEIRRQLVEDREAAERLNAAKSEFLANMSHEIRTPLHTIVSAISLTLESPLNEEQRGWLEGAQRSAVSLNRLIDDILDTSKIEAGKLDLEDAPFGVAELLGDLTTTFQPMADAKGLQFFVERTQACPERLLGDVGRVRQILVNLLGNAIKFTQSGSVSLSVDCSSDSQQMLYVVRDTGIGVPREQQQSIFEAFSQADTSITRRFGGTGLGLSISAKLAALMGGRIQLVSPPGKGSSFTLVTPLREAAAGDACDSAGAPEPTTPLRILVAEDSPMNQVLSRRLLERRGHQVEVVDNGVEAVRRALRGDLDVILMDCQMPDMGGFEATAAIRAAEEESGRRVQIVATTAHAVAGYRQKCLDAGMDDYLAKPFQPAQLAQAVAQAAQRARKDAGSE